MAERVLLGNIKGEKGDTGSTGGFNGETLGVNNMINLSDVGYHASNNGDETNADIENGLISFNDLNWYFTNILELSGSKYTFKVKDYKTNPSYNKGMLQVIFLETNNGELGGANVKTINCLPNTNYTLDLTGREKQLYRVEFRVSNSNPYTGYLEKPMLVDAEYPVTWHPSYADLNLLQKQINIEPYLNASLTGVVSTASYQTFVDVNLVSPSVDSNISLSGNTFKIPETGNYTFILSANLSPVNTPISLDIYINVNGVDDVNIYKPRYLPSAFDIPRVVKLKKDDVVKLRVAGFDSDHSGDVSFGGTSRNKLTVSKN